MEYVIICVIGGCMGAALAAVYFQREESRLLTRLQKMIEDSKGGRFVPLKQDETLISSVENSMSQLLDGNWLTGEELRSQKEKIQTLITDISHQTITPISNILLYSQLVGEQVRDTALENSAEAICQQAEKLSFLIDSLVKASRLEAGIIKTELKEIDPCEIICKILDQAGTKAQMKQITLHFQEPENETSVVCDPKWTAEALFNILDNAIKYTPRGGMVTISVVAYTMFCKIDIADNGVGMEEEDLAKIFTRFYRAASSSEEDGIGLGLYLAREIISSQKGYIRASSKPGKGSCFSVFLSR